MADIRVSFPKPCSEEWQRMAPIGRARMCARCDKAVHDLREYSLDEAEALARREAEPCVRAEIGADGTVDLKSGMRAGRMVAVAVAMTAGLGPAPAAAQARSEQTGGAITGVIQFAPLNVRVVALREDGRVYVARVGRNGRYRISGVASGRYTLTFTPSCGESWTIEGVQVSTGETRVPPSPNEGGCIVVGMLQFESLAG